MVDCFKSLCWSLSALEIIRRKPSVSQIRYLVSEASKFKLPDEKAVRTMKFMLNRACQWQSKIRKALSPLSGETKPISINLLQELQRGIRELPLIIPEVHALCIAIQDNGTRPSDGNPMLFCDSCDKWFHVSCMKNQTVMSDGKKKWSCPTCSIGPNIGEPKILQGCISYNDLEHSKKSSRAKFLDVDATELRITFADSQNDVSPHAPDPTQLWPPFGLLGSKTAIEALGPEFSSISDIDPSKSASLHQQG